MKPNTFIYAVLAITAVAQPHNHANKRRHVHGKHQKRALVTEWVTETAYVTEWVDSIATVWVDPNISPTSSVVSTSSVPAQFFEPANEPAYTTLSTSIKASVVATPVKELVKEPVSQPPPAPITSPSSTTAPASQTPTSEPVPTSTSIFVAPAPVPTTSSIPAPAPQTTSQAVAAAATVVYQVGENADSSSSSNSGGEVHSGDLTYYTVGLGACGEDDSGKDRTENIVAISHLVMGAQSNGNPYCGKKVKITINGKTTTATVRDKCMGCKAEDIDVSEKCFLEMFDSLGVGRKTVEWSFIN